MRTGIDLFIFSLVSGVAAILGNIIGRMVMEYSEVVIFINPDVSQIAAFFNGCLFGLGAGIVFIYIGSSAIAFITQGRSRQFLKIFVTLILVSYLTALLIVGNVKIF